MFLGTRADCCGSRRPGDRPRGANAGGRLTIGAGAVVIADGGFPGNPALFRKHIGPRPDRVVMRHAGTAVGDGLRMAEAAGAALINLDRFYGHLLSRDAMDERGSWPYPQIDAVATAAIVVDGRAGACSTRGSAAFRSATTSPGSTTRCAPRSSATRRSGRARQGGADPAQPAAARRRRHAPPGRYARRAGRGGGAAGRRACRHRLGLQRRGPRRSAGDAGAAALEPQRRAAPIETPPFFAIPICAGITNTLGGIAIDGHGRVKRPDGSAIAGLYAAGGATGGLEGGGALGYVGGLIKACVFGLRVARTWRDGNRAIRKWRSMKLSLFRRRVVDRPRFGRGGANPQ